MTSVVALIGPGGMKHAFDAFGIFQLSSLRPTIYTNLPIPISNTRSLNGSLNPSSFPVVFPLPELAVDPGEDGVVVRLLHHRGAVAVLRVLAKEA